MQAVASSNTISDPLVQQHFDRSAMLYVDHSLEVYRNSVTQRLDLLLGCGNFTTEEKLSVLDIGCGGGAFLDMFLERFEKAEATGIDISEQMLRSNRVSKRKTLRSGDALALPADIGFFDVVCVDTVMHHLISRKGYEPTRERILLFLKSLHHVLKPGGTVVIREIYHEYRAHEALGSRIIYELSTLPVPHRVEIMLRAAGLQTANVGVCFQTRSQWQQMFKEAGFTVDAMEDRVWPGQPYRRFGFTQSGDLHFILKRTRPAM
jgi:SAM-dependent methyltransferase